VIVVVIVSVRVRVRLRVVAMSFPRILLQWALFGAQARPAQRGVVRGVGRVSHFEPRHAVFRASDGQ
jgi:hypothetical protein